MDKNNENEVQGFYSYNLNSDGEVRPLDAPRSADTPRPSNAPDQPEKPPARREDSRSKAPRSGNTPPSSKAPRPVGAPQPAGEREAPPAGETPPRQRQKDGDFKVNFDFDREYNDVPEEAPIRVRRERRTGCLGGTFFAIFVICISVILASLLWLAVTDVLGFDSDSGIVQITVPKDYTIDDIADLLYDNGLIKYKSLFKFYSGFSDAEEKISSGTYELNLSFDYRAIVDGMSSSRGTRVTVDVTFPEGFTMLQMFAKLEEEGVCGAEDLWAAASSAEFDYDFLADIPAKGDKHRFEGFLFPDTYTFYMGDTPSRVLTIMLKNFDNRFKEEYYTIVEESEYTLREIIIIASMIEREAGVDSDRKQISSVIYNRLKSDEYPRLEIDATIHYAIAETGEAFSTSLDSPYNTYRSEGLPPGPISNPGLKSIQAALEPDDTDFYFYALKHDKSHKFSTTYEEHVAFVNSDEYGG